jgi:glycosyltransferase involved in cell wall biosynthesis
MRVRYDDEVFRKQRRGGISRYFAELMVALRADESLGVTAECGPRWTGNRHLVDAGLARPLPQLFAREPVEAALTAGVSLLRAAPDVWHRTFYGSSRRRTDVPTVVTVHDMTPELLGADAVRSDAHVGKRAAVAAADHVICVSAVTRADLLRLWPELDPAKVSVVPLGVGGVFSPASDASGFDRVVVHVGPRAGYKNWGLLVRAVADIPRDDRPRLLCVGGGHLTAAERQLAHGAGLEAADIGQVDADDAGLVALYRRALAVVVPSTHEGFGLPALEAMASGCPVVLANAGALPEVGGAAALYAEPDDDAAVASHLQRLGSDLAWRATVVAAQRARAAEFSWARTAQATAAVYRSLVG